MLQNNSFKNFCNFLKQITAIFFLFAVTAPGLTDPAVGASVPAKAEQLLIKLSFIGDIMAHDVNYNMKDYSKIYAGVKQHFNTDDLTFANLEFPMDSAKALSNYPAFNVPVSYAEEALKAGIEVFSAANNHMNDLGKNSVIKTIAELDNFSKNYGLVYSGVRTDEKNPYQIETINKNGIKIGFIAFTQFLNSPPGKELIYLADYNNPAEKNIMISLVKKHAADYDLFIFSYHGGAEYRRTPLPSKKAFFLELAGAGAAIVWGHHPHVTQGWELIKKENRSALVIYSAGNFISGQTWNMKTPNRSHERLYTGESWILKTAWLKTGGGLQLAAVNPVYISNYQHPKDRMIVVETEKIFSEPLNAEWKKFYMEEKKLRDSSPVPLVFYRKKSEQQ
jgi:poly-gamma-glutamate synthesis protein (capsule biosynthesis protein)